MDKKNKVNERLGYCGVNLQGSKFRVVHYKNNKEVWVEFYEHSKGQTSIVKTQWDNIERKNVMDKFYPSVYGVGYVGNTKTSDENGKLKRSYDKWTKILQRCYNEKSRDKFKTYEGCTVEERWKCFEFFEKDYEELVKENNFPENTELALDKDIIHKGNKTYSKKTCVIVDQRINSLFVKRDKLRGNLPIGVQCRKNIKTKSYIAQLSSGIIPPNHKKQYRLSKCFPTPLEAFQWYKEQKEKIIKSVADEYLKLGYITSDSRLYKAMYNWVVEITD